FRTTDPVKCLHPSRGEACTDNRRQCEFHDKGYCKMVQKNAEQGICKQDYCKTDGDPEYCTPEAAIDLRQRCKDAPLDCWRGDTCRSIRDMSHESSYYFICGKARLDACSGEAYYKANKVWCTVDLVSHILCKADRFKDHPVCKKIRQETQRNTARAGSFLQIPT
ncbi:unnamed protein product, partial [Amoebophrya sp. A25]